MREIIRDFEGSAEKPKYRRLQNAILGLVLNEHLRDGTRLPPDNIIAAQLGVSLGTVQKALTGLVEGGVVTRAPRRGTVISASRVAKDVVYVFRFRDAKTGELIRPGVRMLNIDIEDRPGPWREYLGDGELMRFERLMRVGLEAPVYSEVFTKLSVAGHLLDKPPAQLNGQSLHHQIEVHSGLRALRSRQFVSMGQFDAVACQHLLLEKDSTGLIWDVVVFGQFDEPITFQRIQLPPTHRAIEFDIDINATGTKVARS